MRIEPTTAQTCPRGDHDPNACTRAWCVLRTAHARIAGCLGTALARSCGLGISDFEVLLALRDAEPAQRRVGDLGDAVALSQPALSRLVARLEERGFVSRCKAGDDQRAVLVALTEAGRDALGRAIPLHAACVGELLLDRLTDEEHAALVAILGRVR